MIKVKQAEFVAGYKSLTKLPFLDNAPEVALIGRSNVGKSTLINRLLKRRKIAHTSSTPGRTQEINYFKTEISRQDKADSLLYLVDLPGYGYAKFSKQKRENLSRLTVEYLQFRNELQIVCLLNDCRRMPQEEEFALRDLLFDAGKLLLVVLTKADKLKKNELIKQKNKIANAYSLAAEDLILSGEKHDVNKLWQSLSFVLN